MLTVLTDKINDLNLNIDLFQKHDFVPKSESIKKYIDLEVEKVLAESRLSEKDLELISFIPNANFTLRAYFNNTTSYNTVGFTNLFLTANTLYTQESYYVFDLFDTFEDNNQTLIYRLHQIPLGIALSYYTSANSSLIYINILFFKN